MTQYDDLAKIRVDQAISEGMESQRIKRLQVEEREVRPGLLARLFSLAGRFKPTRKPAVRTG